MAGSLGPWAQGGAAELTVAPMSLEGGMLSSYKAQNTKAPRFYRIYFFVSLFIYGEKVCGMASV